MFPQVLHYLKKGLRFGPAPARHERALAGPKQKDRGITFHKGDARDSHATRDRCIGCFRKFLVVFRQAKGWWVPHVGWPLRLPSFRDARWKACTTCVLQQRLFGNDFWSSP